MREITYIIQASCFRNGHWTPWICTSPQYQTLAGAREQYDETKYSWYIPECVRLVRVTTRWEQIPGVRCAYNDGTRRHVYASKRLRCKSPICRATKREVVPK
jgi:hypothetical protein